jgi:4-aminobutyrate aminotransferase-like enzyme
MAELAEALNARFEVLTGAAGKDLFTTGGRDAIEVAIKLARRNGATRVPRHRIGTGTYLESVRPRAAPISS